MSHGEQLNCEEHRPSVQIESPQQAFTSSNILNGNSVTPATSTENVDQLASEKDQRTNASPQVDKLAGSAPSTKLSDNASTSPQLVGDHVSQNGDSEHARARSPSEAISPADAPQNDGDDAYRKLGEDGVCRMHKFWLYETASRFYVVGGDIMERKFRILKLDRAPDNRDLSMAEDDIVYTKKDMNMLLDTLDDGNKASGGMKLKYSFWGLLGFVRFTGPYYMLIVTKRSAVATIGGHHVYQIDGTELLPLTVTSFRSKIEKDPEEGRFIGILNNLDLTRSFYFSYSYDITRTLQRNIIRERRDLQQGHTASPFQDHNSMFVWNHHFLRSATSVLKTAYDWCFPIVHGFVNQAKIIVLTQSIYVTLIARRSRFFAGARFLKRGTNDLGYVANDVETEQIVSHMLTTSFHAPGPKLYANPNFTAYVQHRGSIPLYWTQDNSGVSPKPEIELNLVDPFYSAAALHFDDLFERYGSPIYVLNLIKSRERTPREFVLLREYDNAILYLNQSLPKDHKIRYRAWDMARASKSDDQDVIGTLESIAGDVLDVTGFFRNGLNESDGLRLQNGIVRTNCIDCLDRTNAAQFVISKRALTQQLLALGVISDPSIEYDTDAVAMFEEMFHNHGNTIAIQYGGSQLVNTVSTYRKINQWSNQSQQMVENLKRYYNNSLFDKQRQEAYNLFLGNYIFAQGQPMLWDLSTDYYLHHIDPQAWYERKRRSYRDWFTPENLSGPLAPKATRPQGVLAEKPLGFFDEWWIENYRPHQLSVMDKMLANKIQSTSNLAQKGKAEGRSPFKVNDRHEAASPGKPPSKKGVTMVDPVPDPKRESGQKLDSLPRHDERPLSRHGVLESSLPDTDKAAEKVAEEKRASKNKSGMTQWTLAQFVTNSLNPCVADNEAYEYQRYVSHPLNLPLVVSTKVPPNASIELLNYVESNSVDAVTSMHSTEDDLADYAGFLDVGEEPLTVTEADTAKKRYKAYRQWVKGKSLFKQRADP